MPQLRYVYDHSYYHDLGAHWRYPADCWSVLLAEWMILKKFKGFSPILLMDDIFEKLDENRMVQLLAWVSKATDGQVFITDTHKDRLTQLLGKHLSSYQLIEI